MTVLFPEISAEMNFDLVQIGMIWGIGNLTAAATCLFAGMLGDRYGVAKTLAVSCFAQSIFGALRGISNSYESMLIFTLLFGLVSAPLTINTHKAAGQWFSGKQLGLANGILAMGIGVGYGVGSMISATWLSPLLDGWRNVLFLYGGIGAVIAILWVQTFKHQNKAPNIQQDTIGAPIKDSIRAVVKLTPIWILSIGYMFFMGARSGVGGYLPTYLRSLGWDGASSDGVFAALSLASVLGVVPLSLLSDKIGIRKAIIIPAMLITSVCTTLLGVFDNSIIWAAAIMIGLLQEGIAAGTMTMVMETKGVGHAYAGTALGLFATFAQIGNFAGSPMGNKLAESNPLWAFIFWGSLLFITFISFLFVRETGWRRTISHQTE